MIIRRWHLTYGLVVLSVTLSVAAFAENMARPRPCPSPSIGPAILVDSTGKQIGPFDWLGSRRGYVLPSATVVLKINGLWVAVDADHSGFGNHGGSLYYTTNDCSGTAYYAEFFGHPVVGSSFSAAGILHYANLSIAQDVVFASQGTIDASTGTLAGCSGISTDALASPDQILDLSTLGFTPPFTLAVSGVPVRK